MYIDGGYSGKDLNRPEIQRLIEDCKNHKIDAVFVFKLDRISRSQKDTLYLIEEVFNKYNVDFISMRENLDTSSPFGKAMIGVLSVFAQLERETILERTRIGLQKRAEAGLWRGGGKIPFPYRYDKESGTLIPIPEQVELLHKMISMYISGKSFNAIGKIVGMDESMVESRILSITNTGRVPYRDEVYEGKHEAVVSDELHEEILRVNKIRSREKYERHYLLSGKVFCGCCGAKYRYQKWGKRLIMYCYSQQKSKPKYIKDPNCKNKRWDTFEVEDAVLEELFKMSIDVDLFKKTFNIATVNVKNELNSRLEEITKQINNLLNFIATGVAVEETNKKITELEKEIKKNKERLNVINEKSKELDTSTNDIKEVINNLNKIPVIKDSYVIKESDKDKIVNYLDKVDKTNNEYKNVNKLSITLNDIDNEISKKNKVIRNLVEENSEFHREIDELNEKIYYKSKEILDKDLVIAKLEDENNNLKKKLKYYVDKFKKLVNHFIHKMFKKDREIYNNVAVDLYEHDILGEDELKEIRFNYIESHSNSYENKDKDDFEL